MTFIQILLPDLLVVGDGERIDMFRKAGVDALDPRVIGVKLFAGHAGLVRHSVTELSNDNLDYGYVSWAFHNDLMVDSTHELFVAREYRNADLGLLNDAIPCRKTVQEFGTEYVRF